MGTQTEIVRLIREKKADYVLALKTNHPTLHAQVKNWFLDCCDLPELFPYLTSNVVK